MKIFYLVDNFSADGSQWDEFLHTHMDNWKIIGLQIPLMTTQYMLCDMKALEKNYLWSSQNANILECPF